MVPNSIQKVQHCRCVIRSFTTVVRCFVIRNETSLWKGSLLVGTFDKHKYAFRYIEEFQKEVTDFFV